MYDIIEYLESVTMGICFDLCIGHNQASYKNYIFVVSTVTFLGFTHATNAIYKVYTKMENISNIELNENSLFYIVCQSFVQKTVTKMYKDIFQLRVYSFIFIYLTELSSNLRICSAVTHYVVTVQACDA